MTASESATLPRSWAEDCQTYRDARGSRSLSTVAGPSQVPPRYPRTNYAPLGAERHPLFAYDMYRDGAGKVRVDPRVQADREARHGWGDVSLLKEDGVVGRHRSSRSAPAFGKGQVPAAAEGNSSMRDLLQQTGVGAGDAWIGNNLINPTKGKLAVPAPCGPKGRTDMADVLSSRHPGVPSDDSWLGHKLIDPARGKARPPGPEELRGRAGLQDVIQQTFLREPEARRFELLQRGGDPLSDGWVGHTLIDPNKGKAAAQGPGAVEVMQGGSFKSIPPGHTDFPRPHAMAVPPPVDDCMRQVLDGSQAGVPDWGKLGRRPLSEPKGQASVVRPDNLYSHMSYRDLSPAEARVFARNVDDGKLSARRHVDAIPGSGEHGKGADMLQWKPKETLAQFVPFGKLAQQTRTSRKLPPGGWK